MSSLQEVYQRPRRIDRPVKIDKQILFRLAVYLRPRRYTRGVKYIGRMDMCFTNRDGSGFLANLIKYIHSVQPDDVARFRAVKMIDKCYVVKQVPNDRQVDT